MRFRVQFLASLSRSRIWRCSELQCRSQTQLGSVIAVAVATAPIRPLSWEPPYASGAALEKTKKKKKKERERGKEGHYIMIKGSIQKEDIAIVKKKVEIA